VNESFSNPTQEITALTVVDRHRTAIARSDLSRPVALVRGDGLLTPETTFFDYGCGRGGDLHRLAVLGHNVAGWDPVFRPDGEIRPSDIVNLGFVINVIEDPIERAQALLRAWTLTRSVLVVAARPSCAASWRERRRQPGCARCRWEDSQRQCGQEFKQYAHPNRIWELHSLLTLTGQA
jgi:hypothetical protein